MARGKRSAPALTITQEITRQGINAMLTNDEAGPAGEALKEQFFTWLRKHRSDEFADLVDEFALSQAVPVAAVGGGDGR